MRCLVLPGTLLTGRSLAALGGEPLLLGEAPTLDDEVDRLAALAPSPAVWIGHSLGGIVALELARRYPDRVAALVLLATNARAGRDTLESRRVAQWALAQRAGLSALVVEQLAPAYGLAADDPLTASLAEQAESVGLARFEHQLNYARQRPGLLAPPCLLPMPMLALSGEHDALCPPTQSDELLALAAAGQGEHQMLAGAGHLFPMQQGAWAAAHLQRFLTSLERS